jgi:hypothetical protein
MTMTHMDTSDRIDDCAAELVDAARTFQAASGRHGAHAYAPDSLASLEEALQALSGACYQLAADASPVYGLPRELEARLMAALHDVAAAFARCARDCRDARSTVAPIIARRAETSVA